MDVTNYKTLYVSHTVFHVPLLILSLCCCPAVGVIPGKAEERVELSELDGAVNNDRDLSFQAVSVCDKQV